MHKDKLLHFLCSLLASLVDPWLAVGLGIGKEYGDSKSPVNKWDWLDILADGLGIAVGVGMALGVKLISSNLWELLGR